MKNEKPYILGLDVGPNSIGWAVIDCEIEDGEHKGIYAGYKPVSLRALNSRIFQEMVEAKTQVPKNQKRREARGARNRRAYYKKRRKELVEILMQEKLLPEDYLKNPQETLQEIDRKYGERKVGKDWSQTWTKAEQAYCSPYAMRHFALEEKLAPYEFGRLLLHLHRRRGYFSNRGAKYIDLIKSLKLEIPKDDENAMSAEEKKETGRVLTAIDELNRKLNGRTLGQFIWQESQNKQIPPQRITLFRFEKTKERGGETVIERLQFRAKREMYEQEFDAIWNKQSKLHSLSDARAGDIKHHIFHQRPLQLQKGTVGNCNIYPNKKRTAMMRLEFQEFRALQMINNIKICEMPLNPEQRQQLLVLINDSNELNRTGRIPWKKVAQTLSVNSKKINYSQQGDDGEGKTGLIGNRTAQAISRSISVQAWQKLGKEKQSALVEDLLTMHNRKALYDRLINHWKFAPWQPHDNTEEGALGLAMNEQLEDGYGKHSLKAINTLLPHLRNGLDYYKAVEKIGERESITKTIEVTEEDCLLDVKKVPNVANPIVQKALYEIRRVVNAVIRRYGQPAIIRMEMGRDMKSSKKHRREIASQQKANRKTNEDAEAEILKYYRNKNPNVALEEIRAGVRRVKPGDRAKFKMWKYEQDEQCPYCQKQIGPNELFSGEAEIEHILPYTGFRQNYMNTVVSCRSCNEDKAKRTPYEAWGSDADRWQRIEKVAKEKYSKSKGLIPKQRNILKKNYAPEDVEDFVERQLNDTRYIAAASKKMLEHYSVPIDVNNGAATSELRRWLGLNKVLPREPDAGAYTEAGEESGSSNGEFLQYNAKRAEKSRQDHRHHAVDAFIVAITDRAMLKAMIDVHAKEQNAKTSSRHKTREDWIKERRLRLSESWKDGNKLHSLLSRKLNATVVSHMTKRKIWGALHEETLYRRSHFDKCLRIEEMKTSILKKVETIAQADANDDTNWIADEVLRAVLLKWAREMQGKQPSDRSLPHWKGKELKGFVYHVPCISSRKKVTGELLSKLDGDWIPGTGTWIAEKSIHGVLSQWLKINHLVDKTPKEIDSVLEHAPPFLPNKKGRPVSICRVRIAQAMTDSYVRIANSYIQPGSNHHLVFFHNGKEGEEKKRRFQMVTMLEAARRASAGKPVIIKESPPEWEGEWHYELDLCVNDMVYCQDMSIFEDTEKFAPEHGETPYFRVQTMSGIEGLDLRLRHHSISGTDSDWGLWRIRSLSGINCKKVQLGNLGLLSNDS